MGFSIAYSRLAEALSITAMRERERERERERLYFRFGGQKLEYTSNISTFRTTTYKKNIDH